MSTHRFVRHTVARASLALAVLMAPVAASAAPNITLTTLALSKNPASAPMEIGQLWSNQVAHADTVLIGTAQTYADNLASGYLQGLHKAPLLYIEPGATTLPTIVSNEIDRLGAKNAIILGGAKAVPDHLAAYIQAKGLNVTRIGGPTRVETAINIASKPQYDTVLIVRGYGEGSAAYADSLAAGAYAAKFGYPVLLNAEGPGGTHPLHPNVAKFLSDKQVKHAIIIGGESAVSGAAATQIAKYVDSTERISGASRIETAINIYKKWIDTKGRAVFIDGYKPVKIGWHNGFAAALTAANNNAPILLVNGSSISPELLALLQKQTEDGVAGFVGTYVDQQVIDQAAAALGASKPKPGDVPQGDGKLKIVRQTDSQLEVAGAWDDSMPRKDWSARNIALYYAPVGSAEQAERATLDPETLKLMDGANSLNTIQYHNNLMHKRKDTPDTSFFELPGLKADQQYVVFAGWKDTNKAPVLTKLPVNQTHTKPGVPETNSIVSLTRWANDPKDRDVDNDGEGQTFHWIVEFKHPVSVSRNPNVAAGINGTEAAENLAFNMVTNGMTPISMYQQFWVMPKGDTGTYQKIPLGSTVSTKYMWITGHTQLFDEDIDNPYILTVPAGAMVDTHGKPVPTMRFSFDY